MKSNTKVLSGLIKSMRLLAHTSVRVGVGPGTHPAGINMLELALIHEFGTSDGTIPARPFIRNGLESVKEELGKIQAKIFVALVAGKITPVQGQYLLGRFCVHAIQTYLRNANDLAPLADSTVAAKGHDKPLIETGALYDAITYEVVEK